MSVPTQAAGMFLTVIWQTDLRQPRETAEIYLLYMEDITTTYGMKKFCRCYTYNKDKLRGHTRRETVWATRLFYG